MVKIILHFMSVMGTFMFLYGILYLTLKYTIGFFPFIRNTKVASVPLELPLFSIIVIVFILMFVKISSPWIR